jgi:hypothetical protein
MICRYCKKEIEEKELTQTTAYWYSKQNTEGDGKYPCHIQCKKSGEEEEAYACQNIDANCNDCAYFKRGARIDKHTHVGLCAKFNKEVFAQPKVAELNRCFIHRKDI